MQAAPASGDGAGIRRWSRNPWDRNGPALGPLVHGAFRYRDSRSRTYRKSGSSRGRTAAASRYRQSRQRALRPEARASRWPGGCSVRSIASPRGSSHMSASWSPHRPWLARPSAPARSLARPRWWVRCSVDRSWRWSEGAGRSGCRSARPYHRQLRPGVEPSACHPEAPEATRGRRTFSVRASLPRCPAAGSGGRARASRPARSSPPAPRAAARRPRTGRGEARPGGPPSR